MYTSHTERCTWDMMCGVCRPSSGFPGTTDPRSTGVDTVSEIHVVTGRSNGPSWKRPVNSYLTSRWNEPFVHSGWVDWSIWGPNLFNGYRYKGDKYMNGVIFVVNSVWKCRWTIRRGKGVSRDLVLLLIRSKHREPSHVSVNHLQVIQQTYLLSDHYWLYYLL